MTTQTQVGTMRRMDVSVRQADSPDGTSLATVSGFYGTAIGPAGGASVAWAGVGGTGPGGMTGDEGNGGTQGDGTNPGGNPGTPPTNTDE